MTRRWHQLKELRDQAVLKRRKRSGLTRALQDAMTDCLRGLKKRKRAGA